MKWTKKLLLEVLIERTTNQQHRSAGRFVSGTHTIRVNYTVLFCSLSLSLSFSFVDQFVVDFGYCCCSFRPTQAIGTNWWPYFVCVCWQSPSPVNRQQIKEEEKWKGKHGESVCLSRKLLLAQWHLLTCSVQLPLNRTTTTAAAATVGQWARSNKWAEQQQQQQQKVGTKNGLSK